MLAAKPRRKRTFLERIIQRRLRLEEVPHRKHEGLCEFLQKQRTGGLIEFHVIVSCRLKSRWKHRVADQIADGGERRDVDAENEPACDRKFLLERSPLFECLRTRAPRAPAA